MEIVKFLIDYSVYIVPGYLIYMLCWIISKLAAWGSMDYDTQVKMTERLNRKGRLAIIMTIALAVILMTPTLYSDRFMSNVRVVQIVARPFAEWVDGLIGR